MELIDILRFIGGCMAAWLVLAALSWLLIRRAVREAPVMRDRREDEP